MKIGKVVISKAIINKENIKDCCLKAPLETIEHWCDELDLQVCIQIL